LILFTGISTSAKESDPLDALAPSTTILNDVIAFSVRSALLNFHYGFAVDAGQEIDQRALIVVQIRFCGIITTPRGVNHRS
jgi:hypothetical protein